ncbi:Scr1 family TA system antitoxin-like transcriptional regulator [Streptomyces sp. NPDC051662]|uniref:helix-turn-helix domain-containing protein n=1 Tax=Streptomyces sp. NPDC051662 TaxID=3154750 RepID=UPI0034384713
MTTEPTPRVVGAILRDARERRMMLPEQPAELLGVAPETVLALESGRHCVSTAELTALTGLYRCGQDTWALRRLLALGTAGGDSARDSEPGYARRLAACAGSALSVRWLSTVLLPAALQTRDYARAVAERSTVRHGAPVPGTAAPLYVLDVRVIRRGSATARLMAEQVEHLLDLVDSGTRIRVVGEEHPIAQPPGHLVELDLPAGRVLARPGESGVDYHRSDSLAARIDAALAVTDRTSTYEALEQAAASHRALAETGTAQSSWQTSIEGRKADVR